MDTTRIGDETGRLQPAQKPQRVGFEWELYLILWLRNHAANGPEKPWNTPERGLAHHFSKTLLLYGRSLFA